MEIDKRACGVEFEVGDRVVHSVSGEAGVVVALDCAACLSHPFVSCECEKPLLYVDLSIGFGQYVRGVSVVEISMEGSK